MLTISKVFQEATVSMEQGLLDATVAGVTEAADDRQPKTLHSLKVGREKMADLGPKTTLGQVGTRHSENKH